MPSPPDPHPPGKPAKGQVGRPSSGVPRAEQIRRAVAARRAGFLKLQLLVPPTINEALEAACKDHGPGKADYAVTVLVEHLQRTGFYKPPENGAVS
jgi:hypothetical protein